VSINVLGSEQLKVIFSPLQDREMQLLGSTSKKLQDFAKEALEERDKRVDQLLPSYTITRRFNVRTLREADLFLLGELHDRPQCLSDQVAFINFLASRGPVILICEGYSSMSVISKSEEESWLIQIKSSVDPTFRDNIYAIGWDRLEELKKIITIIDQEYEEQNEQLDVYRDYILNELESLPKDLLLSSEELDQLIDRGLSYRELWHVVMETLRTNCAAKMEKQLFTGTVIDSVDTVEAMGQFIGLSMDVEQSFANINAQKATHRSAAVKQTFPLRTEGMITTLKKIDSLLSVLGIRHAKAVLIAGCAHLAMETDVPKEDEWDLTTLYGELNHHRAAILLPIEIWSTLIKTKKKMQKTIQKLRKIG
jgi:hypothetical protein